MKRNLFIVGLCLMLALVIISCDDPIHEHSYGTEWKSDATNHWHECECGEKTDVAAHSFGGNTVKDGKVFQICGVCNYEKEITDAKAVVDTASFLAAIKADGVNTIVLANDIALTESITINDGKSYVIDLNGHTISKDKETFIIEHGTVEFKGKGTIQETVSDQYAPIIIKGSTTSTDENYSVVTVGKDVTLKGWAGLFIRQNDSNNAYGVVINMHGKIVTPAADGHSEEGHGIYINGLIKDETGKVPVINLDGAEITSKNNAIYAAGYAKWNIKNTTMNTAYNAIVIAAGEFEIEEGTEITAGSKKGTKASVNGSITQNTSSAIYVKQHSYNPTIKVSVKGGEFSSYIPFYQDKGEAGTPAPDKVTISIEGGTYTSNNETDSVSIKSEDKTGFITGGTFSTEPTSTYIAEGYKAEKDGTVWKVVKSST